ncbi:citryl-CoA lyase [Kineosporia succinea]|uniref:citrate synthase (unknown stereospecificity) n=1 Tax=Kineosporia succinea TaxID=84632 RepID=A0ABT9PAJ0_9ACTN|nr:citryl-CoA lyase [Kineosporia succinea]MDP9829714.1 citrate synthase [Kineosporia succinea]
MSRYEPATLEQVSDWWATAVTRIAPGEVEYRGIPVQELIGQTDLVTGMWLLVRGDRPTPGQAALLQAAIVAAFDHGPQAPSIAVARMAVTCGIGINNAMASAVNTLGDSHGGAGQQCVALLDEVVALTGTGVTAEAAALEVTDRWRQRSRYLPGFGHRFHPRDPRRDPLLGLVAEAVETGVVAGHHLSAALAVEARLDPVPMNIDGATAVIYAELGFEPELARGFFVLSRSVGILAHAWEERQSGRRNKGPIPPSLLPTFLAPAPLDPAAPGPGRHR